MMTYYDATMTPACCVLYIKSDRRFWCASDLKSGLVYGRIDGRGF